MKKRHEVSILKRTYVIMTGFGLVMGLIFPAYAAIFVEFKSGLFVPFFIGCLGAGFFVGFFACRVIRRVIGQAVEKIGSSSARVAARDLSGSIDMESADMLGTLADSVNSVTALFRETLLRTQNAAAALDETVGSLSGTGETVAEKIDIRVSEILGVRDLLSALVENLQRLDREQSGFESRINDFIRIIGERMRQLNEFRIYLEQSDRMSEETLEIIEQIDGISRQTNLLALNATIQAEKAGISGRGFGVVARNIGELAAKTAESALAIRKLAEQQRSGAASEAEFMGRLEGFFTELSPLLADLRDGIGSIHEQVEAQEAEGVKLSGNLENLRRGLEEDRLVAEKLKALGGKISGESHSLKGLMDGYRLESGARKH